MLNHDQITTHLFLLSFGQFVYLISIMAYHLQACDLLEDSTFRMIYVYVTLTRAFAIWWDTNVASVLKVHQRQQSDILNRFWQPYQQWIDSSSNCCAKIYEMSIALWSKLFDSCLKTSQKIQRRFCSDMYLVSSRKRPRYVHKFLLCNSCKLIW